MKILDRIWCGHCWKWHLDSRSESLSHFSLVWHGPERPTEKSCVDNRDELLVYQAAYDIAVRYAGGVLQILAEIDHPFTFGKLTDKGRELAIAEGVPTEQAVFFFFIFDDKTPTLYGDYLEEILVEGVRRYGLAL